MQLRRFAPMPIVGIVTFHHVHDVAEDVRSRLAVNPKALERELAS